MQISNVRHALQDGYPVLELYLDGQLAQIPIEQKPLTYRAGLIFLGPGWENRVPEIDFRGTPLRGFTNDPEVLRLYNDFGAATRGPNFKPGSVDYP